MQQRSITLALVALLGGALHAEAQYVKATVASFSTASSTYVNVPGGTVSFTPASASDIWVLLFSARIGSSSTTALGSVEARYLVNGVEHGMGGTENTPTANQAGPWTSFYRVTGTTALQTVQVQLRDLAGTGTIQQLSIIAFKLPEGADFHYSETETDTAVPQGWATYQSLTVNPSSPGTYLVMGLVTGSEGPGTQALYLRFKDPVGNFWPPEHEPGAQVWDYYINPSQMYQSFFAARAETLSASSTYQLEAYYGGSPSNGTVRYRRFMAFRVDAFETFESVQNVAATSATSTTPVVKSQLQTSLPPVARDYIVIQHLSAAVPSGFTGLRQVGFEADNTVEMSYAHSQQSQFFTTGYSRFDAKTTDHEVTYENTFSSSTGNEVRAKESVIHVLRLPSTTYDAYRLIGFETGDTSEMAVTGPGATAQGVVVRPGSGSFSLREGSTSTLASGLSPAIDKFSMRWSFRKPTNPGALQTLVQLKSGATNQWSLALTTGGQLQVQQQAALGLSTTTGTTVLENNRWYTVRIVYDAAAGGRLRVILFNVTEVDTSHSSAGTSVDAIDISGLPNPNEFFYDDFFVARSAGPLPMGQIVRRGPNGAGFSSGFDTPIGSATHFQNVDEVTPGAAGDADYNQHAASTAATDLYALQDSTPGPINAVKAMWRMQHSAGGGGTGTHDYAWRENGVTSSAEFLGLGTAWQTRETIWSVPPSSGGSWTETKLNGLELGAAHNGTLGQDLYISWTTAMVDYRPQPRYRSIGTAGPYTAGSVGIARGAYTVHGTGTAWKTANRGRGDRFTVGGVHYTIASVDSETRLTLREPFEGATVTGAPYTIARQYSLLQTWSDCVTGNPASCSFFPVVGSDLITENRSEIGIAYDDSTFTAGVQIDTSTTDANHTIKLTADDGNRHYGIPGAGVWIDNSANVPDAVRVQDDYVTVEWLEVSGGGDPATDAVYVAGQTPSANHVVVRNMLLHDQPEYGITTASTDLVADLYNNILYGNSQGFQIGGALTANARVRILNNTVYDSTGASGISTAGGASVVLLRNNIAHTTAGGNDYAVPNLDASSSHNLASDLSGTAHSPGTGGQNSVSLANVGFVNEPARDLHITPGSFAADAGADLSSLFSFDVDGGTRAVVWDVGADDLAATTEVDLVSFTARGLDGAVLLEWETASELDNLGFHLYRSRRPTGAFTRITDHLIPGLGSSPSGASYRFRDGGLLNGETYYYQLEDVESTGRTERHGPLAATPGETPVADPPPRDGEADAGLLGITYGDPSRNSFRVLERGRRQIVLELVTEGLHAVPQDDGTLVLAIPDFAPVSPVSGDPSIPVKRPWLDIGEGNVVEIVSVQASAAELLPAWPLAGAELMELSASRRGTVRLARRRQPSSLSSSKDFPSEPARILDVGYQGATRRAQIELAPLRWDAGMGRLRLTRRLVVRLSVRPAPDAVRNRGSRKRAAARSVLARLATEHAGLHVVRFEDLFPNRRGRSLSVGSLRLSRLGETIPFHVEPDSDRLTAGSRLYFVSPGGSANPYGREAVFELELAPGRLMETRTAVPWGEPVPFWWVRTSREENRYYQAGLVQAPDIWLWDLLLAPQTKSYPFQVSELASALEPAGLEVWMQGVSDAAASVDHHLRVSLNGVFLGETEWNGKQAQELELEVPQGLLREGENALELESAGDTGAPYSMVMLNRFSILYPRRALAGIDGSGGRPGRSGTAESSGGFLLDVSGADPVWLIGTGGGFRVEAEHEYLVVDPVHVQRPVVRMGSRPWLSDERRGADYLAIAPRAFRESLEPLLSQRRSEGLRVELVDVESIYEEFGFGERRPEAIRDFLRFAYHSWSKPSPSYVLLAGDGTYDFKDYLGTGVENQVPPYVTRTEYLWTASDPTLAAVNGDDLLPDLAIGRLPAANAEELGQMVEKILAYERSPEWLRDPLVLVADDADDAGNFSANEDALASSVLSGHDVRKLYLDRMSPAALRDAIREAFDEGAGLVSYAGHGGIHLWAEENVFQLSDVDSLAPRGAQTFVVTMNCLNGYFHFPYFDSLAERLVKSPGKGAVAVFSPSGLSLDEPAQRFQKLLLREALNGSHARLGDAVLAAQRAYAESGAFPELLSIYHLFGDPALRLR